MSNRQTTAHQHHKSEDVLYEIQLTATISITDATGTAIEVSNATEMITLLNQRPHRVSPVLALDPEHKHDPFFECQLWRITRDLSLEPVKGNESVTPDYTLRYTDWQLSTAEGSTSSLGRQHPGKVAQHIAEFSQSRVILTSELPGFETTSFAPNSDSTQPTDIDTTIETMVQTTFESQGETQQTSPEPKLDDHFSAQPRFAELRDPQPQSAAFEQEEDPAPRTRREARESFLTQTKPQNQPATKGWRGAMVRMGFRMAPSATEQHERDDVHAVSQHWPGPRTIAVVNGKGGVGKTPTTILLSAIFARYGGGGVLAWDNNQARSTMGWRTEQSSHDATILDLIPVASKMLATGAQSADLSHYVHHQTQDRFDVLRSKPQLLAEKQRFDTSDVDTIHAIASKFYRIIVIDSGNDESDPMWRRMITHTDQLVVATSGSLENGEAARLLLEELATTNTHGQRLADNAVIIASQSDANATQQALSGIVNDYLDPIARQAVGIPYDPAMVEGHLKYASLRPETQRAWLRAAAAVARGL